ncbi:hypothetical protein HN011_001799 [Eciton burchellii]|nr:hypothetical protein HN011_001799 [Eciton burchellii]
MRNATRNRRAGKRSAGETDRNNDDRGVSSRPPHHALRILRERDERQSSPRSTSQGPNAVDLPVAGSTEIDSSRILSSPCILARRSQGGLLLEASCELCNDSESERTLPRSA